MWDSRIKSMCVPSLTDVGGNGSLIVCLDRLLAVLLTLSLSAECIQVHKSDNLMWIN